MAQNDFEAVVRGVSDFLTSQDTGGVPVNPPLTQTASSHAITIRTQQGIKIGRIQNWGPGLSRQIDTNYELDANSIGEPIERVPQNMTRNSIAVDRYELYATHIGEAFRTPVGVGVDLVTLANQIKPFHVREVWTDPFGGLRAYLYANCWFSDWGITISATDDRIIKARATIEFTRRLKLQ